MSPGPWFSQVAHQMPPLVALTPQLAQALLTLPMICSEDSLWWVMIAGTSSHPPLPRRPTPGRFSLEDCHQTLMKVAIVYCPVASTICLYTLPYVWCCLAVSIQTHYIIHIIIICMDSLLIRPPFQMTFVHIFNGLAWWLWTGLTRATARAASLLKVHKWLQ